MTLPGWLLCWKLKGWRLVRKHKKGVRVPGPFLDRDPCDPNVPHDDTKWFRCGRCGATWTRKARKAKP